MKIDPKVDPTACSLEERNKTELHEEERREKREEEKREERKEKRRKEKGEEGAQGTSRLNLAGGSVFLRNVEGWCSCFLLPSLDNFLSNSQGKAREKDKREGGGGGE